MAESNGAINIFVSYSHVDENYRKELEKHLSILRRSGIIRDWHDRQIRPGEEWELTIDQHLRSADVILLLISPDFVASEYCWGNEMSLAMDFHENGSATVVPILIRPIDFDGAPFAKLQMLPKDARPVALWSSHDEAWAHVTGALRKMIDEILQKRRIVAVEASEVHEISSSPTSPDTLPTDVHSYELFSWRISDAFPGVRGRLTSTQPIEIVERLAILLRNPLSRLAQHDGQMLEGYPFWWFRGGNNEIRRFERLQPDRILIWPFEIQPARIIAVREFSNPWRDFLYLEASADSPVGIYPYGENEIRAKLKNQKDYSDYHVDEEYALWNGTPISRAEYDDASAVINGRPTPVPGADLRIRFLTPSNMLICGKKHVINQLPADRMRRQILNGILKGTHQIDDLTGWIESLPLPRSYDDPAVW